MGGQPMARAAHHHHPHHPHHHQQQQQHYEQYVYPHHVHGAMGDEEDEDGFEENPLVEPLSSRNSANSGTGNAMSSCKNPVENYWNQRHAVDPRNRIGSIQSI